MFVNVLKLCSLQDQSNVSKCHTKVKRLGPNGLNLMQNGRAENVKRRSALHLKIVQLAKHKEPISQTQFASVARSMYKYNKCIMYTK